MSKISVIVPVYNVEEYIHRCVDSILAQTFSDFELILVDDGSSDNCPKICDKYAMQDSRVHVIHLQNGGVSVARNAGIEWALKNSNSEWISFIDSDDWVSDFYLEYLYKAVQTTRCNISMCLFKTCTEYLVENTCTLTIEIWEPEEAYSLKHTVTGYGFVWGRLYRKSIFTDLRFPEGVIWEDILTLYKFFFKETKIAVVPNNLYYYYVNPNGYTHSLWTPQKMDIFNAVEEVMAFFYENKYEWLLNRIIQYYFYMLIEQYEVIKNKKEYFKYKHQMVNKGRFFLKKYKALFPISDFSWMYEFAYPKTMYLYWVLNGICSKFNDLFI